MAEKLKQPPIARVDNAIICIECLSGNSRRTVCVDTRCAFAGQSPPRFSLLATLIENGATVGHPDHMRGDE